VLGVDIARNLVEAGNLRAKAADLTNLRFQEGDASQLTDLDDQSFDLTMSIFGAAGVVADRVSCEQDTFVFDTAAANGRADELQGELEALFVEHNQSGDPQHTCIPATFLRVTAQV